MRLEDALSYYKVTYDDIKDLSVEDFLLNYNWAGQLPIENTLFLRNYHVKLKNEGLLNSKGEPLALVSYTCSIK